MLKTAISGIINLDKNLKLEEQSMKYRCKNCYKVLGPQEEYCTNCGEHSKEIQEAMLTGNYDMSTTYKMKLSLILYACLAIALNGIVMITIGVLKKTVNTGAYGEINSLFASSIVSFMVFPIVFRKDLKSIFFNGTKEQYLKMSLFGLLSCLIILLLSYLFHFTSFLPSYVMDFLQCGEALKGVDGVYLVTVILSFFGISVVEEMVFRKYLIDAFDDGTLLSDFWIIIISSLIATLGDFMWTMGVETIICSAILNLSMSAIYMYTNRSLGINILLRFLLVIATVIIFVI